ncbi:MAG: tRNA pseudouridine(38-40) synthase TruA [bacterium]|nr:tRNA pseudouridine(38-40) synthase TruA [bacterium]
MRYALDVQYIGKNYAGSQIQFENGKETEIPTIQGELEKAICTLIESKTQINKRPIRTIFSGRTDRGVNAIAQVIHFDTDKEIVASSFIYHINEILPADISVNNLRLVSNSFHAQKSAKSRFYRYELINRRYKQAFDGDILRVKYGLDISRMQKSLNYLLGEHDFSSFKSSGTLNPSKICSITRADVEKQGDRVFINIEGNRFLYNMVRTIVGTLLEIEGHDLAPEYMKMVLEACDRRKAGQTVSPYGLTLIKVDY